MNNKKRVALLMGGMGAEREVSLVTGKGFAQALVELGHPHITIDCREDFLQQITEAKNNFKADVALLALHGKYAEDGIVQGICEYIKLPYTGAGVMASALCMDKVYTKEILVNHQIPTPDYQVVQKNQLADFKLTLSLPVVVKPSREGSSVGVSIVKESKELEPALKLAASYDQYILIEKYIPGMELTISILGDQILTPIEIVPKVDFYDYKNKYTAGRTEYIMPARLKPAELENAKQIALKTFQVCRVRTYGRVDFRVDPNGQPYVMEVNTLPGCTPTSLLPKAARDCGISFNQLIDTLISSATLDYAGVK